MTVLCDVYDGYITDEHYMYSIRGESLSDCFDKVKTREGRKLSVPRCDLIDCDRLAVGGTIVYRMAVMSTYACECSPKNPVDTFRSVNE